jgi:phosphoesterase RecJ-like protein
MRKIIQQLEQSKDVLVASHIIPDGDAIGSLIAMALSLESLGKRVSLYNESLIPAVYRFLPSVDRIQNFIDSPGRYDTAVVLDCGDYTRIGELARMPDFKPVIVNIDHHSSNTGFGHARYVDPNACATAEIVHRLIKAMEVPVTQAVAMAIYTAIFTDTGSFRFANTNRAAFSICDEMVDKGVEPYTVAQHVYGTYSLGRIKLLNLALDSIEISENGKWSFMTLTRNMLNDTGTQPEDIDGMINYAKRIQNVQVAVLIQEHQKGGNGQSGIRRFHVSLRSDGSADIAALAADFGGGGHPRAAGFDIETNLTELKSRIIAWLKAHEPGKWAG